MIYPLIWLMVWGKERPLHRDESVWPLYFLILAWIPYKGQKEKPHVIWEKDLE